MIDRKTFTSIFKASPTPTLLLRKNTSDYEIIAANPSYLKFWNTDEVDVVGKRLLHKSRHFSANNKEVLRRTLLETHQTKKSKTTSTFSYVNGDSVRQFYSLDCTPILDDNNEVEFILCTVNDRTTHVQQAQEHKVLFNQTDESFVLTDTELNILKFNSRFRENCKKVYNKDVNKGDALQNYILPVYLEDTIEVYKKVLQGENHQGKLRIPLESGGHRIFDVKYKPAFDSNDSIYGTFTSFIEVTQEYQVKNQLKVSEARYRALVENGTDVVFILSAEGIPTYVSPSVKNVLGYTTDEVMKLDVLSLVHPDDIPHVTEELGICLGKPEKPIIVTPARMLHKDGSWRWFEGSITNMLHDPYINGIVDNFRDITKKVEAEEAHSFERRNKEALINSTTDYIWSVDNNLNLITANKALIESRKKSYGEDLKSGDSILSGMEQHPEIKNRWKNLYKRALTGETFTTIFRENGSNFIFENSFNPIYNNNELIGVTCYSRNITERKELENLLSQAQRLARIGGWNWQIDSNKITWTSITKEIHEVEVDFEPDFDTVFNFYKEGKSRDTLRRVTEEAIKHGTSWNEEVQIVTAKGNIRWVKTIGEAEFKDDTCLRLYGSFQDIHDRKQAEENLHGVANNIPGAIFQYTLDEDGSDSFLFLNEGSVDLWGISRQDAMKNSDLLWSQVHQNDVEGLKESIINSAKSMKQWSYQWRSFHPDGTMRWHEGHGTPKKLTDGTTRWDSLILDITPEKEAEQELKFSEQRFKALVQDGSDLISIMDENFNFTYLSPSHQRKAEDYVGMSVAELIHEDDHEMLIKALSNISTQKRITLEPFRMRDLEGNWNWMQTVVTNLLHDPAVQGYVANSRKITQQIERENKLKELSLVASKTTDLVVITDAKGKITYANNAFIKMSGYSLDEVKGQNPTELLSGPKTNPQTLKQITNAIVNYKSIEVTILNYKKDGSSYWMKVNIDPIINDNGKTTNFIAIGRNVTKEVQEEERLKLLESVVTNTLDLIVITEANPSDLPGRKILFVNEAFTNKTGYTKEEVIGKTPSFLNGPNTSKKARLNLRESMERFEPAEVEFINYKKNGEEFWLAVSMVPVVSNKGNYTHWVAIGRDITDQKNKECEIQNSLKEKETLLAEIHHRVKNNLAVVSGMMQLQAFETESEDLKEKLYDSVGRIKTMGTVHELLYKSNSFSNLEFSDTLKKLIDSIRETLQTTADITIKDKTESIRLNINQAIPTSLIVNEVVTNSFKHAFAGRKKGTIKFDLHQEQNTVFLEISDNGVGLPEDIESLKQNSLGFQLIEVLSQQLDADYSFKGSSAGTIFSMKFDKKNTKGTGNSFF